MVMGSPQMRFFSSLSPFPYGDYHMEMVKPMVNYSHMVIFPEFPNGREHLMEMG